MNDYTLIGNRIVTVDLDIKNQKKVKQSMNRMLDIGCTNVYARPTTRGYHIRGELYGNYYEVLGIRLVAGDDIKRLQLDALPEKHAKNVLFTKKKRVKTK